MDYAMQILNPHTAIHTAHTFTTVVAGELMKETKIP